MNSEPRICILAKPPVPGRVNTRLAPALGEAGAARLARAFLEDVLAAALGLGWARVVLASSAPMADHLPIPARVEEWPQGEGDLGARMARVLTRALSDAPFALVLGVDSPGLPRSFLEEARTRLADPRGASDAVVGPTEDGGYYALGLRACSEELLDDLPWSRADTGAATIGRLEARGRRVHRLPGWYDVDRPADLVRLRRDLESGAIRAPATHAALLAIQPA